MVWMRLNTVSVRPAAGFVLAALKPPLFWLFFGLFGGFGTGFLRLL
jgi:hypothetical protein